MLKTVIKSIFLLKSLGLVGLMLVLWIAFRYFLPESKRLDETRLELATRVVEKIAVGLPRGDGAEPTLLIPLEGDRTGEITDLLREGLERTGLYEIEDRSALDRLFRDLNYGETRPDDLADARQWGEKTGSRFVITGKVVELVNLENRRRCEIAVTVIDAATTGNPFEKVWSSEGNSIYSLRGTLWSSLKTVTVKIFLLAVFVLLLPIVTFKLVQIVTARESNALNLFMLIGYTLADTLLAYILLDSSLDFSWKVGILFPIGLGAFWLNAKVCEKIEESQA